MRLVIRSVAATRMLWPADDGYSALVHASRRSRTTRAADDEVRETLAAVDAQIRAASPWMPDRSWLDGGTQHPIASWPADAAAALARELLLLHEGSEGDCESGPQPLADLPLREVARLYESLLALGDRGQARGPGAAADILLEGRRRAGGRKTTGSYYTPDHIVSHVTRRALGQVARGEAPEAVLALAVLDPAMGAGCFLLDALSALADELAALERRAGRTLPAPELPVTCPDIVRQRWLVAGRCLYGVDQDAVAVDVARFLVWATIGYRGPLPVGVTEHLRAGNSLIGCRVEDLPALPDGERMVRRGQRVRRELLSRRDRPIDATLRNEYLQVQASCDLHTSFRFGGAHASNAPRDLFDRARELALRHGFFHWDLAFPEVFCGPDGLLRPDGGFDAIIGNPPYAVNVRAIRSALERGGYATLSRAGGRISMNTAAIFIDRAHQLLRPGGVLGFIVPNSILRVGEYARVRQFLLENTTIHEIVDEGSPFEAANLGVVSFVATRRPPADMHRVLVRDRRGGDRIHGHVEQRLFAEREMISLYLDDIALAMEQAPERLGQVVHNRRGASIPPTNLVYLSANPAVGRWMLRGRNLMRYGLLHVPGEDRFLRASLPAALREVALLFDEEKVLIQNIGSRVVAALSTGGEGFLETVNILRATAGSPYSHLALLVLLNARLMSYYFQRALINRSPLTVHLDGIYTDAFPLPDCTSPLDDRAAARLVAERAGAPALADGPAVRLLEVVGARLADCAARWSGALAWGTDELAHRFRLGTKEDAPAALSGQLVRRDIWLAETDRFVDEIAQRDPVVRTWPRSRRDELAAMHRRALAELSAAGTAFGRPPFPYEGSWDWLADRLVYSLYGLVPAQAARVDEAMRSSAT